jgi:hypothetical protein
MVFGVVIAQDEYKNKVLIGSIVTLAQLLP